MKKRTPTLNQEVTACMFKVMGPLALILITAIGIDIAKLFN
jgi:hypothetical protein